MYTEETTNASETTANASETTANASETTTKADKVFKVTYKVEGLQALDPNYPFDNVESEVAVTIPDGLGDGIPGLLEAGKAFLADPAVARFVKSFEGLTYDIAVKTGDTEVKRERLSVGKKILQGFRMLQARLGI